MFLKSLEVRGFKSFADKTELKFKKGVTAVVGPNGSGKSNISDSVRWVLGEQSVKSLRGGKMEDVIFAGTQFRKPVGLAQVSLTLDNSNSSLPIEYNEVTVTRRIFRSGETEYLINNQKCRLKDITELFMDTGIGKEGYSIIGQGKIDAILSGKPEDRRALLEEAAGIVKFKSRKEEAEKKLQNTDNNLVRIKDIISTYEERLGPLKNEKEKALKYQQLATELREKEVSLLIHNINKVKFDIEIISSDIKEKEEKVSEKREALSNIRQEVTTLEEFIDKLDEKNKNQKEEYYNKKALTAQSENDIQLYKERINNYKEIIRKEENEVLAINEKINSLQESKVTLDSELKEKQQSKKEIENTINSIDENVNLINSAINGMEKELLSLKGSEYEFLTLNSEISNELKNYKNDILDKEEKKIFLENSILNQERNIAINKGTIQEINNKISGIRVAIEKDEFELSELKKQISVKSSALTIKENKIKAIAKNINGSEATLNTLINLENHYEGYNRTVKALMEHAKEGKVLGIKNIKVLGEVFEIDRKYEIAMEIALGAAISNVITKTDEDAKKLIQYLKANHLGRATFLPLNIIKGKKLQLPSYIKECDGYIGIASDIIHANAEYREIIEYTLGRTIIATNMDAALNISKLGKHSYKIVTLNGEVINPGGSLTGGSIQGKSTNLLGRKREIEELRSNLQNLKVEYSTVNNEVIALKDEIKVVDENILAKREEIHGKNIDLTVFNGEAKNLIMEREKLKKYLDSLREEIRINTVKLQNLAIELRNKEDELLNLDKQNVKSKEFIQDIEGKISEKRIELEKLRNKAMELKVSQAALDESILAKKNEYINKVKDIEEKNQRIKEIHIEIKEKKDNINLLEKEIGEKKLFINNIESRILDLETSFKEDEIKKIEIKEKMKTKESKIVEIVEILRLQENELNKKAIQNAKLESEYEALYTKLNVDLNLTYVEALEIAFEITNYNSTKEEVYSLKTKISGLGNVNLASIIEFDEVLEKYEFMSTQELDLQKAKEELLKVIFDMTEKMQKMFRDNFEILNRNFSDTFRELFKGGTAELILGEGDELSASIIINVQPPGKKLQNINLMSGGEKVLSAIALLFAILKMKPTPFCILDEIEAALDDANVYRYAEFLKAFSTNIQFIVITHRKGTMEASDMMYGVTMEEKGVSKVVSVDLSES